MRSHIYISRDKKNLGFNASAVYIKRAVNAALSAEGIDDSTELNVLLCDDEKIKELNHRFRNIDKATDVLSFPMQDINDATFASEDLIRNPENGAILLGDIAISMERCEAQAAEYDSEFKRELQYLTVHSVLHLLSYDHMSESDKKKMRAREKFIMNNLYEGTDDE